MTRRDENKHFDTKPTGTGLDMWDFALIVFLVLCIYSAIDPSAAGDLVDAVGKAVGR